MFPNELAFSVRALAAARRSGCAMGAVLPAMTAPRTEAGRSAEVDAPVHVRSVIVLFIPQTVDDSLMP